MCIQSELIVTEFEYYNSIKIYHNIKDMWSKLNHYPNIEHVVGDLWQLHQTHKCFSLLQCHKNCLQLSEFAALIHGLGPKLVPVKGNPN